MKELVLQRTITSDDGTFGHIDVGDTSFVTAELPYRHNKPSISCIPTGTYKVMYTFSPTFKRQLYELVDVPSRSNIRIHIGNYAGDTSMGYKSDVEGCILIGYDVVKFTNTLGKPQKMITKSKEMFNKFVKLVGAEPFSLIIRDYSENK